MVRRVLGPLASDKELPRQLLTRELDGAVFELRLPLVKGDISGEGDSIAGKGEEAGHVVGGPGESVGEALFKLLKYDGNVIDELGEFFGVEAGGGGWDEGLEALG